MLNPEAKRKEKKKIGIWVSRAESHNPNSYTEAKSGIIYVGTNQAPCHLSPEGQYSKQINQEEQDQL